MSQKLKTVREVKTQGVSSKFEKMLLSFSCESSETSRAGGRCPVANHIGSGCGRQHQSGTLNKCTHPLKLATRDVSHLGGCYSDCNSRNLVVIRGENSVPEGSPQLGWGGSQPINAFKNFNKLERCTGTSVLRTEPFCCWSIPSFPPRGCNEGSASTVKSELTSIQNWTP